jgi:ABC-2 type transport system permease protein
MLRSLNRTLSFFVKWLAEVVRQPGLMLSLIVGPFIILLAFGQGVKLGVPRPRTILVEQPAASGAQTPIAPVVDDLNQYLEIVGQTPDLAAARRQLEEGRTDLVAVLPADPMADVRAGRRATVEVLTDDIDPVRQSYTRTYLREQVASLNQKTVQKAIEDAQGSAAETQTLVSQMREYVRLARMAQGDAAAFRRQIAQLKTATDRLATAAGRAGSAAEGVAFVVPGLEGPLADVQGLDRSVDALKQNVDSLDAQLAPGGAVP